MRRSATGSDLRSASRRAHSPRLALIVLLAGLASPSLAADFTVDVGHVLKPVDHAASGALYGIAGPGWPPESWITAIHPKNFTQMAPGGQQLPNGETAPVGDALIAAPIAARAGASVTIRLPDIFPSFPYIWTGADKWNAEIARITAAVTAANPPNIYGYEIWNEPDFTWQPQWGDFNALWAATFASIRKTDPTRRIIGPSATHWDAGWMRGFLTAAIASGRVPDIISWHELDPANADNIEADVAGFRALEKELGLAPHPISINEYGSQRAMAAPGPLLHYIAQLERAGVDNADLAFWHRPGRLSDLLVPKAMGTGPATDPDPTGGYWLYKWYGDMTGGMIESTAATGSGLDGIASYDSAAHRVELIVGGKAGTYHIVVGGLGGFAGSAMVAVASTDWTGTDGTAAEPSIHRSPVTIHDGTAAFDVTVDTDTEATEIVLSEGSTGVPSDAPVEKPQLVEAESGTITGGRRFTIRPTAFAANRASGDAYVGFFNHAGAKLSLPVAVSAAGLYRLTFGYSNGQSVPIGVALAVNDQPAVQLQFRPTQGRELFGQLAITVPLPAGASAISLTLGAPMPGLALGPSVLEIDRLEISGTTSR